MADDRTISDGGGSLGAEDRDHDHAGGDDGDGCQGDGLAQGELDGRTLSEIKRNRIDLSRRYVFLCPTRLNHQFEHLPAEAKDSALLVFRCARHHVFPAPHSARESRVLAHMSTGPLRSGCGGEPSSNAGPSAPLVPPTSTRFSKAFLQWLHTKEKEDSVFWYKPDRDLHRLSTFLEGKICPLTEEHYRPLILDSNWWRVRFDRTRSRFVTNPVSVVEALNAHSPEYREAHPGMDVREAVLQELLFQSNPTLEPLAQWPRAPSTRCLPTYTKAPDPSKYGGYIVKPYTSDSMLGDLADSRLAVFPARTCDRMDNLHSMWQLEERALGRTGAVLPPRSGRLGLPSLNGGSSARGRRYGTTGERAGDVQRRSQPEVAATSRCPTPFAAAGNRTATPFAAAGGSRSATPFAAPGGRCATPLDDVRAASVRSPQELMRAPYAPSASAYLLRR
mmetsp:Transcript_104946/g.301738  ORF Transcript_104946/g.301738 Transcript_104946/m.301738 type:complete len:448 (+) Transcript_104946:111-1454(+)